MAARKPLAQVRSRARTASPRPRGDHSEIDQADLGLALARQHPHEIGIVHRFERMILSAGFRFGHCGLRNRLPADDVRPPGPRESRRHQTIRIA